MHRVTHNITPVKQTSRLLPVTAPTVLSYSHNSFSMILNSEYLISAYHTRRYTTVWNAFWLSGQWPGWFLCQPNTHRIMTVPCLSCCVADGIMANEWRRVDSNFSTRSLVIASGLGSSSLTIAVTTSTTNHSHLRQSATWRTSTEWSIVDRRLRMITHWWLVE